jgi:hypothetical protein
MKIASVVAHDLVSIGDQPGVQPRKTCRTMPQFGTVGPEIEWVEPTGSALGKPASLGYLPIFKDFIELDGLRGTLNGNSNRNGAPWTTKGQGI